MANNTNSKFPWGRVIEIAIAILTVIAGMICESCTGAMSSLRAML